MDAATPVKKKAILQTEKLQAYYLLDMQGTQKVVKAVNEVSLTIYENEIYGIAGESGCGKTTLLKALFNDFVPPMRAEPREDVRTGAAADPNAGIAEQRAGTLSAPGVGRDASARDHRVGRAATAADHDRR